MRQPSYLTFLSLSCPHQELSSSSWNVSRRGLHHFQALVLRVWDVSYLLLIRDLISVTLTKTMAGKTAEPPPSSEEQRLPTCPGRLTELLVLKQTMTCFVSPEVN